MSSRNLLQDKPMQLTPLMPDAGVMVSAGGRAPLGSLDPGYVMELLCEHGVLILRGFTTDRSGFESFTRKFADQFILPLNRAARPKVSGDADVMTAHVDVGYHPMGLHQELSFTPVRPEAVWLWCERTAGRGGETTVADGALIYSRLPERLRALFAKRRLKYSFAGTVEGVAELFHVEPDRLHDTLAKQADVLQYTQAGNQLSLSYLTPAFQKTKYGGQTTFSNFLLFSQTAAACGHPLAAQVQALMRFEDDEVIPPSLVDELSAIAEPLTYAIKWEAGDILMIDNTRMMHGRRGFEPDSRRTVYYRAARKFSD